MILMCPFQLEIYYDSPILLYSIFPVPRFHVKSSLSNKVHGMMALPQVLHKKKLTFKESGINFS